MLFGIFNRMNIFVYTILYVCIVRFIVSAPYYRSVIDDVDVNIIRLL